jgi:hypothetical protein
MAVNRLWAPKWELSGGAQTAASLDAEPMSTTID